jgi:hypothetical protein
MPSNPHIVKELNDISQTVANLPDLPVFTVPENYFEQFPEKLMSIIRENARKEINLIAEDAGEEINQISPLLGGLKKAMPFSVPEGYFSQLEEKLSSIPGRTSEILNGGQEISEPVIPAKILRMSPVKQMYKLAAAAIVAGLIGVSAWFYFHQEQTGMPSIAKINAELPTVPEKEMKDFLLTIPDMPEPENFQVAGLDNLNFQDMLKDVKDDDLLEFVEESTIVQPEKMN